MQSSIWFQTLDESQLRLLAASDPLPKTADVAIIGAGMIGLATAYYLSLAGVSNLCILDRDTALAEASGANAGGLWFSQQSPELGPLAPLAKVSSRLYDELAVRFPAGIRRTGLLELGANEEWMHAALQAGFRAQRVDAAALRRLEPALTEQPAGAVFYPDDGQVHPAKLGAALVAHLKNSGVRFCLHTEVSSAGLHLETARGGIDAGVTVIASGAWTPIVTRALGWRPPIKPMRGQLLATPARSPFLRHTIVGPRYYYWQLAEGPIAGGGTVEDAGFERGTNPADLASIREEMNALLPALADAPTACAWSGFRPYCEDLKPVIGRVPGHDRLYVAAGHFKKGIMLAPVTGKILADLITTAQTDLPIGPLDPARFPGGRR
ncbi:MAG: FAD-binding oxidoreductase [Acidobacteria bacterium]|nr:FAD-binding oxidoreductase [Acidobacteriota bacterium]